LVGIDVAGIGTRWIIALRAYEVNALVAHRNQKTWILRPRRRTLSARATRRFQPAKKTPA